MESNKKLTYRQWRTNLWLYIVGAVSAYVAASVISVDFTDARHITAFFAGAIAAGIIPAKAYTGRAADVEAKEVDKELDAFDRPDFPR